MTITLDLWMIMTAAYVVGICFCFFGGEKATGYGVIGDGLVRGMAFLLITLLYAAYWICQLIYWSAK